MGNYTLDQAQRDIAGLRFLLTALANAGQLGNATIAGTLTLPDGSTWTVNGLSALKLVTQLAILYGGTGATTAAGALSNLGGAPLASPTFTGTVTLPDGTTWTSTALGGSWTSLSLNTVTGSGNGVNGFFYRKIAKNILELEWDILMTGSGNSFTIGTLPSGFRPVTQRNIISATYGASFTISTSAFPHFSVDTNGTIVTGGFTGVAAVNAFGTAVIGLD